MSTLEKIFNDSINGPQSIDKLSTAEWITLISIHNKKYVEALVECGGSFDLYLIDTQKYFRILGSTLGANHDESQIIEMNNIYTNSSTFLFPEEKISKPWVKNIISLYNKGFLNFPPRHQDKKNLLDELKQIDTKLLNRSKLTQFPVLIPTLNVIRCNPRDAERHFITKTPQYARYTEAILIVKNNPKAMKSIHDVFASLIYVDEVLAHYESNVAPYLVNTLDSQVLGEFLEAVKLNINENELSERELNEALQFSCINLLLNWLFKAEKFNKNKRLEFLRMITLQNEGVNQVRQYIIENNLQI